MKAINMAAGLVTTASSQGFAELDALMSMTVQLAQVQNILLSEHAGMPWERIFEQQEQANECYSPNKGLASLIGAGPSNYILGEDVDIDDN